MKNIFLAGTALLLVSGCKTLGSYGDPSTALAAEDTASVDASAALSAVLDAQDEDTKARYQYRHPQETLEFFGIEPGMTVVDTLPGKVWYSGILSDYLGADGMVIGANFSLDHRASMGGRYATEEYRQKNANWPETWAAEMNAERSEGSAPVGAFFLGALPEDMNGTADAMIMVRAAHHLHRKEGEGAFFTQALSDAYDVLKPGGVLGIVQHRAPEGNSDEWAVGDSGYVKQSRIIEFVTGAGFELVAASEINGNPLDQPTEEDFVWRLPPSLGTTRDYETNPEQAAQREAFKAIGESDRMTLAFRKPE